MFIALLSFGSNSKYRHAPQTSNNTAWKKKKPNRKTHPQNLLNKIKTSGKSKPSSSISLTETSRIFFPQKPKSGHLIFMTGLCHVNFAPNTAHRDVQCNWEDKKNISSFVSMCLTKYNRQSTDMSGLLSFPNSGNTASQRLKKDLILTRLLEKMCCRGGFSKLSIPYPTIAQHMEHLHIKNHSWLLHWTFPGQVFYSPSLPVYPTVKML